MKRTVALIVLDGWGIGQHNESNPIHVVKPQTIEYIKKNFPSGTLQASGIAVGLPWREEGNSEVGHLTMGIGKVIYQHLPRITLAIQDGSFKNNQAITDAFQHVLTNKSKLHFVGLVGEGHVHSSLEHLTSLITFAQERQIPYTLHLFTDGRDSDPCATYKTIEKLKAHDIASISGRYYAMDRDKHWNLTEQAYKAICGEAPQISSEEIQSHIQKTYEKKMNDEFITPVTINPEYAVHDNDAIFFFNFREDRIRQIGEAFVNPHFSQFPIHQFKNLYIASMTPIREDFNIPVAFPPEVIKNSLGKVLAENEKNQLRIAETQKYAHVTFFFNGLNDAPFQNEYRVLVPSRMLPRQEDDPEMMAPAIATRVIQALEEEAFDFILVNFANPDMIAHTGNYDATIKAIKIIDEQLSKIISSALTHDATIIITSDHGNAERLFNPTTGEPETKHDANPVPIYLVGKKFYKPQNPQDVEEKEHLTMGMLSDIAPTILELMNIKKPDDMTGQSLLKQLLY